MKWEYLETIDKLEQDAPVKRLKDLNWQGTSEWELVSVATSVDEQGQTYVRCFFKRPVRESQS